MTTPGCAGMPMQDQRGRPPAPNLGADAGNCVPHTVSRTLGMASEVTCSEISMTTGNDVYELGTRPGWLTDLPRTPYVEGRLAISSRA